jgi:hypothetical protein
VDLTLIEVVEGEELKADHEAVAQLVVLVAETHYFLAGVGYEDAVPAGEPADVLVEAPGAEGEGEGVFVEGVEAEGVGRGGGQAGEQF